MKKGKQKNSQVIRDALIYLMDGIEKNDDGISQIYLTKNHNYKITEFKTSETGRPIIKKIKIGKNVMDATYVKTVREVGGLKKGDFSNHSIYNFKKDDLEIYALIFSYTSRIDQDGTSFKFVLETLTNTSEEMKTYLESKNDYKSLKSE